jgi:hypothetical protein
MELADWDTLYMILLCIVGGSTPTASKFGP